MAPDNLPSSLPNSVFLSLGLLNIVVFAGQDDVDCVEGFLSSTDIHRERWELSGDTVTNISSEISNSAKNRIKKRFYSASRPPLKSDPALSSAIQEYELLYATSRYRGIVYLPRLADDIRHFDTVLREDFEKLPIRLRQRLLVLTNATLSRQTSQTYAGISPVVETECHYWSHSLLGIGVATRALVNYRRYLENVIARANIVGRLESLKTLSPHPEDLRALSARDSFWQRDHLFSNSFSDCKEEGSPAEVVPSLSSFSGRDGFKSSQVALSAPLEVISSANSRVWSLLTLTHEMTHDIVAQIAALLLPQPRDERAVKNLVKVIDNDQQCDNLLDQIRALFAFALWRIAGLDKEPLNYRTLRTAIEGNWPTFYEGLTHCLDFLYFYRGDPNAYIEALWVSWSAVPNVTSRVRNYLLRCLTALLCNNLEREKPSEASFEELHLALKACQERHPGVGFITVGLAALREDKSFILQQVGNRHLVAKLSRYIFYSDKVEKLLWDEPLAYGGGGGEGLKYLSFGPERVRNPLRFIGKFAVHRRPDRRRSAWLLYQLAFAEEGVADER